MEYRPCSTEEVFASGLLELYADECAAAGLPRPAADRTMYDQMAGLETFWMCGAFDGDDLVGFVTVMTIRTPHYGKTIAAMESIFVHHDYRHKGCGTQLLAESERHAKSTGSIGLMVSAPTGSPLADVLNAKKSYRLSNLVFMKGFE